MSWTMYLYTHNNGSIGVNEVQVRRTKGTSSQTTGNKTYEMNSFAGTSLGNGIYAHILDDIEINNSSSKSYDIRFKCTDIANGYEFVCWHYNIVGDSGTWYDYNGNKISGSDTYDYETFSFFLPEESGIIQIWPEVEYVGITWTRETDTIGTGLNVVTTYDVDISEYTIYRLKFNCAADGTVTISSSGGSDEGVAVIAWLTTDTDWDESTGKPIGTIVAHDSSSGSLILSSRDFELSYDSIEANTNYYLWVRLYNGEDFGSITITINPPAAISSGGTGNVWIYTTRGWVQAVPYVYTTRGWVQASSYVYTTRGWVQVF